MSMDKPAATDRKKRIMTMVIMVVVALVFIGQCDMPYDYDDIPPVAGRNNGHETKRFPFKATPEAHKKLVGKTFTIRTRQSCSVMIPKGSKNPYFSIMLCVKSTKAPDDDPNNLVAFFPYLKDDVLNGSDRDIRIKGKFLGYRKIDNGYIAPEPFEVPIFKTVSAEWVKNGRSIGVMSMANTRDDKVTVRDLLHAPAVREGQ